MNGPVVYVLILLAVAVLSIVMSAFSLSRSRAPGAAYVGLLMIASAIYAGSYALELSSGDLVSILRCIRVEYVGIATLPVWWLLFAYRFAGGRKVRPALVIGLLAVPLVTLVLVWTVGANTLYYARTWLRTDGPFPVIGFERGPWYWVNTGYLWVCMIAGTVILVRFAGRAGADFRRQARLAAIGALAPWVSNAVYLLGATPWGLDPSAFSVSLAGALFAWAMFRHGFLDLIPVARERVLETMREGMVVVDEKKRIVDTNQAARAVLGLGTGSIGRPLRDAVPEREDLASLLDVGTGSVEFSPAAEKPPRRFRANAFAVSDDRGRDLGTALILNDISETAALMERLAALAGTDELTKAFNRRRFMEYGEREMAMSRRMGRAMTVVMLDLDHFKRVNDSFGHAAGDEALKTACARLQAGLRATDLLCRYGGEEFALLLPETEPERGQAVAERLRADIAEKPMEWEGALIPITASFGVFGSVPGDGATMEQWLRQADQALYASKAQGRNRVTRLED